MDSSAYEVVCSSDSREQWLEERRKLVTASDVAALILEPHERPRWMKSAFHLFHSKKGNVPEWEGNEDMQFRLDMEQPIIRSYERMTGRKTRRSGLLLRSKRWPFLGATLDAVTEVGGVEIPLEVKTSRGSDEDWAEGIPVYYEPQIQTQEMVVGVDRGSEAVSIWGRHPIWKDHFSDPAMVDEIVEKAGAFYERLMTDDPPEPDGSQEEHELLSKLYPECTPGDAVVLPIESVEWRDRLDEIRAELKRLDREKKSIENKVKLAIGAGEVALIPGNGGSWSWSRSDRKEYIVPAKSIRTLRFRKAKS